jgi:hypothetical protein
MSMRLVPVDAERLPDLPARVESDEGAEVGASEEAERTPEADE